MPAAGIPTGPGAPGSTGPVAFRQVGGQRHAVIIGALAGLAGAAAFTLFCMVAFAIAGGGWWQPVNLVAYTFWSGAPDNGTFDLASALLGLAIIAVVGIAGGVPISWLMHNIGPPHWAVVLALAVAIPNVVWVIGQGLIWPAINPRAAALFDPLWAWLGHGVYGLVVGLVLVAPVGWEALRRFRARSGQAEPAHPSGQPATPPEAAQPPSARLSRGSPTAPGA